MTFVPEIQALAEELFAVIEAMDPACWRDELAPALRRRLGAIRDRLVALIDRLTAAADPRVERLRAPLVSLSNQIGDARLPELRPEWEALRARLQPAYEELASTLRAAAVQLPSLRPTNYTRNAFHVGMGLGSLLLVQHILTPTSMILVAGAFTLTGWTFEFSRRRSAWFNQIMMFLAGPIAHPHEVHQLNSATWYTTALFLMAVLFSPLACSLGIVVLAVGDPVAAVVGRRFGRRKLINNRSIEGTLAFWISGGLAAAVTLGVYGPAMSLGALATVAVGGALAGALVELFSRRLDDNFTIPLATAGVTSLLMWV
jgi:dolichol kinase